MLRILLAGMVLLNHIIRQGGVYEALSLNAISINYELCRVLEIFTICAVNCYGLITGYIYSKTPVRYTSVFLLWCKVALYCISITLLFKIFAPQYVQIQHYINMLFPVYRVQYWYISAYIPLFFILPYISHFVNTLTRAQMFKIAIIIIVLFPFLSTCFLKFKFFANGGHSPFWVLCLFILGTIIGKLDLNIRKRTAILAILFCVFATFALKMGIDSFYVWKGREIPLRTALIGDCAPLIVMQSIFIVMLAIRIDFKNKYLIWAFTFFAPLSFSVYIIHTHPLIFGHIFEGAFRFLANKDWYIMLPSMFGIVACIVFICCLIDYFFVELFFKLIRIRKIAEFVIYTFINNFKRIDAVRENDEEVLEPLDSVKYYSIKANKKRPPESQEESKQ